MTQITDADRRLFNAAQSGDPAAIDAALAAGADIEARDTDNDEWEPTALQYAAYYDRYRAAERLLARGADPTAKDGYGDTAARTAYKYDQLPLTALLYSHEITAKDAQIAALKIEVGQLRNAADNADDLDGAAILDGLKESVRAAVRDRHDEIRDLNEDGRNEAFDRIVHVESDGLDRDALDALAVVPAVAVNVIGDGTLDDYDDIASATCIVLTSAASDEYDELEADRRMADKLAANAEDSLGAPPEKRALAR